MRRWIGLALALVLVPLFAPGLSQAQSERCFPETGFCISGAIRTYWERNGGLPVFGYPLAAQADATIEGWTGPVQWFERDRLEDHSAQNQGVLAGRLGVERLAQLGRPWQWGTITGSVPGCIDFPKETGYQICGAIAEYWQKNGGLERFGYPITAEGQETVGTWTGNVQYFERRRMEIHSELPNSPILLGLLGSEIRQAASAPPTPTPAPEPTPAPLPPPTYNSCQAEPNPGAAPNSPVKIVTVDKVGEVVRLQNVSSAAVDLSGWHLCSMRGNQEQPDVGGMLAAGETKDFPNVGDTIWSNENPDDGALYNANGQLVSYWVDTSPPTP